MHLLNIRIKKQNQKLKQKQQQKKNYIYMNIYNIKYTYKLRKIIRVVKKNIILISSIKKT